METFADLVVHDHHERQLGSASLERTKNTWDLKLKVNENASEDSSLVTQGLVRQAIELIKESGGGHMNLWVPNADKTHEKLATQLGLKPSRLLYEMRSRRMIFDEPKIEVRPFVIGKDEEAFLVLNNRAFIGHPDQGEWSGQRLERLIAESWFDPRGLLLHERDGRLAGFCLVKVDKEQPVDRNSIGELHVIGVDPDYQGLGLGRQLALAGLDYLKGKAFRAAMLYVEADNDRAIKLYEKLGFQIHHYLKSFSGDVRPGHSRP